jgi:hypothetical protein
MIVKKIVLATTALVLAFVLNIRSSSAVCLDQQAGDTHRFGDSLAASEKYLAIGDTQANRVVVYRHTASRKWERFRIIALPPNPPVSDPSANFGYNITYKLAIAGDTLVIGKVISKMRPMGAEKLLYPYQPPVQAGTMVYSTQRNIAGMAYTGAVYRTSISVNSSLERIDQPKDNELAGFAVAVEGTKIAFAVVTYNDQNQFGGYTSIVGGKSRRKLASSGEISIHNNLLVVGSNIGNQQGRISIFNLANDNQSPKTVEIPSSVAEIALTEKFVIVSEQLYFNQFPQVNPSLSVNPKTLIINISNLSITPINGPGRISATGKRLVRAYPSTPDGSVRGKMELFDLDTIPPKLLITNSDHVLRSIISKDYLFIAKSHNSNVIICITDLSR